MVHAVRLDGVGAIKDVVLVAQLIGDVFKTLVQVFHLKRKNAWRRSPASGNAVFCRPLASLRLMSVRYRKSLTSAFWAISSAWSRVILLSVSSPSLITIRARRNFPGAGPSSAFPCTRNRSASYSAVPPPGRIFFTPASSVFSIVREIVTISAAVSKLTSISLS